MISKAHIVDFVPPVLQRLLQFLHGDGPAAIRVDGLEQLGQPYGWGQAIHSTGSAGQRAQQRSNLGQCRMLVVEECLAVLR